MRGPAAWIARASNSLPVPDFAFDQHRHRTQRGLAGALHNAPHCGGSIDDVAEARRLVRRACAQLAQACVGGTPHIGHEFGGEVKRHRCGAQAMCLGSFDQFRAIAGLGENDPDGRHRGRAGTQVKDHLRLRPLRGEPAVERGRRSRMDFAEVGWTAQTDVFDRDARAGARTQPCGVSVRLGGTLIGEQQHVIEGALRERERNRADLGLIVARGRIQVRRAHPGGEEVHGRII